MKDNDLYIYKKSDSHFMWIGFPYKLSMQGENY